MIKGRMRLKYHERDEIVNAGEVFYMQPGHIPITEEDCELVWFSPKDEFNKLNELIARKREAMKKKG